MIGELGTIEFKGDIKKDEDISAIVSFGDFLAIGSDESKRKIQILKKEGDGYVVKEDLEIKLPVLAEQDEQEIDIEGMSMSNGDTLFVVGSHSLKRLTIKDNKPYSDNRKRFTQLVAEDKKNSIFKLKLNPQDATVEEEIVTIRIKEIIEEDELLRPFSGIPSKENGVDIEGIASHGDTLYLGFRGPVLRGNYVPVMVIKDCHNEKDYELLFVNLMGNGIRDIVKVNDGFLILSGPVGDGFGPYQLYFWDGSDCIIGSDRPKEDRTILLGKIPTETGAKAEGITILEESSSSYTVVLVYDGLPNGRPTLLKVIKPRLKHQS